MYKRRVWNLALVKAEATELTPVVWAPSSDLAHGTWVVSNGATERRYRRPRPGIISANKRAISGGTQMVLGVGLKDTDEGIVITSITEGSGAEKAKLQKGDLIIKVDDQDSKKREDFVELIKEKTAEDSIELVVKRDEETLTLDVELTSRLSLIHTDAADE